MKKLSTLILLAFFSFGCSNSMEKSMNPFFTDYDAPYQIPPFDEIKEEHYMPAFEKGMKEQLEEIDQITNNPEQPTFENTFFALLMISFFTILHKFNFTNTGIHIYYLTRSY